MNRSLARVLISVVPLLSCRPAPSGKRPAATDGTRASGTASALVGTTVANDALPDESAADPPSFPSGMFADLETLCARQMLDVMPRLAKARRDSQDQGDGAETNVVPACAVDKAAMSGVRVSLAAPYTDVKAVTYETSSSTQTNIVVRTNEGWTNASTPIASRHHNDPGCASIVRDGGLTEVRVANGHLIVVDKANRGWGQENDLVFYDRVRSCSPPLKDCTEPVIIGARIVPSNRLGKEKRLFTTTYTVDAQGAVIPARTWDGDR